MGGSYYPFCFKFLYIGKTAKLHNDILMLQQHQGESLSEVWTCFKDLLQKSLIMASIVGFKSNFFTIMSPFISSARLTTPPPENSEIRMLTNLGKSLRTSLSTTMRAGMTRRMSDKPVQAISTFKCISKTPDQRLLELEDHINFLQKGSRPTLRSSTHIPHAYDDAFYSNPRLHDHNEPPKLNSFAFHERTGPSPQPQALGATFEARELTTSRIPEKVLIREEAKIPVTKNINSISLARGEEEGSAKTDETLDNTVKPTVKNPKLFTYPVLSARSYPTENPQCSTQTHGSINAITIHTEQQSASHDDEEKENKEEEDDPENIHDLSVAFITEKVLKFNSFFESLGLVPLSSNTELICTTEEDGDVMFIEIVMKDDNSCKEEPKAGEQEVEYLTYSRLEVNSHITSTSCVTHSL
ncbi:hypothetical protein Tco_0235696 [Tanacetum coccineum]